MRSWLIVGFLFISLSSFGQWRQSAPYSFQKGDVLVNAGLSLGHRNNFDYPDSERRGIFPAVSLTAEYGLNNYFSIGPYFSFLARSFRYRNGTENHVYHANRYFGGLRGSFHFAPIAENLISENLDSEHLDLYVSLFGGYKGTFFFGRDFDERHEVAIGGMLGMRYFFTEHFGLFAEGGYGPFELAIIGVSGRF